MRGANRLELGERGEVTPLPPRARGKQHRPAPRDPRPPSTPACAGQTMMGECGHGRACLYPRVRGANISPGPVSQPAQPLPPRARGKPRGGQAPRRLPPSTPACAGQTGRRVASSPAGTLYPRVRGANLAKPYNTAGPYSRAPRFSFTANPLASSGTRHTPSKTTGPATASSKTTVR